MTRPTLLACLVSFACVASALADPPKLGPAPPIPDPPPQSPASSEAGADPFQQAPRDLPGPSDDLRRASEAFAAKRYAQAATLFANADHRHDRFSDAQKDEWAYCRLYGVAARLNRGPATASELADLSRETDAALRDGSARLRPFGNQLLEDIRRRTASAGTAAAAPAGWQIAETASFRVLHRGQAELASEVGRVAEAARRAMYERWVGPAGANWSPKCDVYMHPKGADYATATGKPAANPGHSTVGSKAGHVVTRRIDLRADEPTMLDGVLPHEVTQVILAELFADQPLPRWASVGMAALAESPDGVARYLRAVPRLLKEKQLFAVGPFMERAQFPSADEVTAFYAESVSLVSYLVGLKGPKAFTAFLQEGPRRGYARALATHYGFKDPADLQDRWVKHVLGGE